MEFLSGFRVQFFTDLTGIASIQEIIRHFELCQMCLQNSSLGKSEERLVACFLLAINLTSMWEITDVQILTYHVEEYNDF